MNASKKKVREPIDKVSPSQPSDRIAELERRILQLEEDVALLKSLNPSPLLDKASIQIERKKRGRKEEISEEVLFSYRDGLILWLERVWPWLQDRLFAAKAPEQLKAILEAIVEEPESRPDCQIRLLQNAGRLFEFIRHEKFRKKDLRSTTVTNAFTLPWNDEKRGRAANQFPTRQIANAMAGVPDISWSRSLDRCYANPSTAYFSVVTEMYYCEMFGMPMPEERYLMNQWAPVPKPLQPISAQPSVRSAGATDAASGTSEAGHGNSATGPARGQ